MLISHQSIPLIPMRIVFRADADKEMGSGHVMRTSVLAQEAISRGISCVFVGQVSDLKWVRERIDNLGFEEIHYTNLEDFSSSINDVVVVDSYVLPLTSQFNDITRWKKIVAISDKSTPNFNAQIVVSQSILHFRKFENGVKYLSGSEYLLLRNIASVRNNSDSSDLVLQILIVGGGTDPFHFCPNLANLLSLQKFNQAIECHFFTPHQIPQSLNPKMTFKRHDIGPEIDEIAAKTDLAFTLASTTSLEFLSRQIPIGISVAVSNQQQNYDEILASKLAVGIGYRDAIGLWNFDISAIENLVNSLELRSVLKVRASELDFSNGAANVLEEILN